MASKKSKNLTPEEAKKFEEMGFELEVFYENKCMLCGKILTSKYEDRLAKRLKKHVGEECDAAKWIRGATKILEIAGLKNVIMSDLNYVQEGVFLEGCERTKPEELEILDNVKDILDSWGKESNK